MMKKISVIFTVIISLVSCNDNCILPELDGNGGKQNSGIITKSLSSQVDTFDINNYPYSIEEDSLFLEPLHGKIVSIIDRNEYYVINDEFIYLKKELLDRSVGNSSRLYGNVLHESSQHIYLLLHTGFDSNMMGYDSDLALFKEAVAEWNNLENCNIFFALSDDNKYIGNPYNWYPVNVYIDDVVEIYGYQEQYFQEEGMNYLWGGTHSDVPFMNLWVNVSNDTYGNFDNETKKYSMMHALAHLVRLKDFELGQDAIPETYNGDINSITYSYSYLSQWGMSWVGFSVYDKIHLPQIYPLKPTSVDYEFVPYITSNELETDKEYTIVSKIDAVKNITDCSYEYVINGTEKSYDYTVANDTLNVRFYNSGIYEVTLNLKLGDAEYSCTKEFQVIGESLSLPDESDIVIGQEFTINWSCGEGESVTFSAEELIFDKSNKNVTIEKSGNGRASILLKDYGSYTITMEKKDADNNVINTRTFHIDRFYRPELHFPDFFGTLDVFDYRQNVFETGRECPENISEMIITGANPSYTITVADGGALQERLYVLQYEKYYRDAFFPPERVDRGPVVVLSSERGRKFLKGKSGIITLPQGKNGYIPVPESGWLTYQGYYAVIIPEDIVYLQ